MLSTRQVTASSPLARMCAYCARTRFCFPRGSCISPSNIQAGVYDPLRRTRGCSHPATIGYLLCRPIIPPFWRRCRLQWAMASESRQESTPEPVFTLWNRYTFTTCPSTGIFQVGSAALPLPSTKTQLLAAELALFSKGFSLCRLSNRKDKQLRQDCGWG